MRRRAHILSILTGIVISIMLAPLARGQEESLEEQLARCRRELSQLEQVAADIRDLPKLRVERAEFQSIIGTYAELEAELERLREPFRKNEIELQEALGEYREFWYGDRERSFWNPLGWPRHMWRTFRSWSGPYLSRRWRESATINTRRRRAYDERERLREAHTEAIADQRRRVDDFAFRPFSEGEGGTTTLGGKTVQKVDMGIGDCKERLAELEQRIAELEDSERMIGVDGIRWPGGPDDRPKTITDAIAVKRAEIAALERKLREPASTARTLQVAFFPDPSLPHPFAPSDHRYARAAQVRITARVHGLPAGVHKLIVNLPDIGRFVLQARTEPRDYVTWFNAYLPLALGKGSATWRITTLPSNTAGASGRWEYETKLKKGARASLDRARKRMKEALARVQRERTRATVKALAGQMMDVADAHADLHEISRAFRVASEARRTIDSVRDPEDWHYNLLWKRFCALHVAFAYRGGSGLVGEMDEWAEGYYEAWLRTVKHPDTKSGYRGRGSACLDIAEKMVVLADIGRARKWARRGRDEHRKADHRVDWSDPKCGFPNLRAALNLR